MGILDCSNFLYSMELDIAYCTTQQSNLGKMEKSWKYDQTLVGYVNVMGTVNLQNEVADREFVYKKRLNGRTLVDPRKDSHGKYHSISDILILDVRDTGTGESLHLNDFGPDGEGLPIIFDVMSVDPFVNPWNEIEYYKILLNRSDNQHLDLSVRAHA